MACWILSSVFLALEFSCALYWSSWFVNIRCVYVLFTAMFNKDWHDHFSNLFSTFCPLENLPVTLPHHIRIAIIVNHYDHFQMNEKRHFVINYLAKRISLRNMLPKQPSKNWRLFFIRKTYLSHYLIRADHQAVITISHRYKLCRVLCYISFIEARSQGSSDFVSPFVRSFFAVMYRLSLVLVCVYIAVSVMLLTCPRDTEAIAPRPGKRSQVKVINLL